MNHRNPDHHLSPALFAVLLACTSWLLGSVSALAQCQTWSIEPKFQYPSISANFLSVCTVFDDGSGPKLWVGGENFHASNVTPPVYSVHHVGRWDGQNWIATGNLGSGDVQVHALSAYDPGQGSLMYAGGNFSVGGGRAIVRWNGSSWDLVGGGLTNPHPNASSYVLGLAVFNSGVAPELYVGGGFGGALGVPSKGIIRWNGTIWSSVGTELSPLPLPGHAFPVVKRMIVYDAGPGIGSALYIAGDFTVSTAGGQIASWLAKWDGASWSSVGAGIDGEVLGMTVWDDGGGPKLYVSGAMTMAGGQMVSGIAVWDGTVWAPFPVAPTPVGYSLTSFDDGTGSALYVGGAGMSMDGGWVSGPVRFDGVRWTACGKGAAGLIRDMTPYDDGSSHGADLYVVGDISVVGGLIPSKEIARWIRCAGPIDAICPGDHTLTQCPCQNVGSFGRGCENSSATGGARLEWIGTTSPDTLRLVSSGELASSLTIFLQGNLTTATTLPFGDGLRCVGGQLLRIHVTNASGGTANAPGAGNPTISERSAALGDPLSPGDVRLYQAYYRDPLSPCGNFFNASSGVRVVW